MASDYEIKGLREDIKILSGKVDRVGEEVGLMRTDTAVITERLTAHIDAHVPIGSMIVKSLIALAVLGTMTLLVFGLREWFGQ